MDRIFHDAGTGYCNMRFGDVELTGVCSGGEVDGSASGDFLDDAVPCIGVIGVIRGFIGVDIENAGFGIFDVCLNVVVQADAGADVDVIAVICG